MKPPPPKLLEMIVGGTIPPACREQVLGDLHERYISPRLYVLDAFRAVPMVILSRIRRTTDPKMFLMEAAVLLISFLSAAWRSGVSPGFSQLAIPVTAALAGLMLANAYAKSRNASLWKPVIEATVGVAFAFLSQAMLRIANPALLLPPPVLLKGGGFALILISSLRMSFQPGGTPQTAPRVAMSLDELHRQARRFEKRIRRRNLIEYAACLLLIAGCSWTAVMAKIAVQRFSSGLMIACALYVAYKLYRNGSPGRVRPDTAFAPLLDFYRRELERQRDLLRRIWLWYLGPLALPMFVSVFAVASAHSQGARSVPLNVVPLMALLVLVWKLNQMAAKKLQREIDAIDVIQKEP